MAPAGAIRANHRLFCFTAYATTAAAGTASRKRWRLTSGFLPPTCEGTAIRAGRSAAPIHPDRARQAQRYRPPSMARRYLRPYQRYPPVPPSRIVAVELDRKSRKPKYPAHCLKAAALSKGFRFSRQWVAIFNWPSFRKRPTMAFS